MAEEIAWLSAADLLARFRAGTLSPVDAPCVARLREAGAVILGKTTTPEFGWKALTDEPLSA